MAFPETPHDERRLSILEKQLERMRSMHYGYYSQFFQALHLFTVITLAIVGLSLAPTFRAAAFLLPFFVVYAGFFCAYLLCYNLFARIYATAVEKKINALMGEDLLVAHRMEDVYFYRTPGEKFVAIDLKQPWTCISASTISYLFSSAILLVFGAYRAWQLLPVYTPHFPPLHLYWVLLAIWTLGHFAYLFWFYVGGKPEKQIAAIANEAYGV